MFYCLSLSNWFNQKLIDGLNYGVYCPPANAKAGKFLDEERCWKEYGPYDRHNVEVSSSRSTELVTLHMLHVHTCTCADSHRLIPGVTGQNMPPAGLYPRLKRPRLDYTRVYYGLGQLIPRGILWPEGVWIGLGHNIPRGINWPTP